MTPEMANLVATKVLNLMSQTETDDVHFEGAIDWPPAKNAAMITTPATQDTGVIEAIKGNLQNMYRTQSNPNDALVEAVLRYITGSWDLLQILSEVREILGTEQAAQWLLDATWLAAAHGLTSQKDLVQLRDHLTEIRGWHSHQFAVIGKGEHAKGMSKAEQMAQDATLLYERWRLVQQGQSQSMDYVYANEGLSPALNAKAASTRKSAGNDGANSAMTAEPQFTDDTIIEFSSVGPFADLFRMSQAMQEHLAPLAVTHDEESNHQPSRKQRYHQAIKRMAQKLAQLQMPLDITAIQERLAVLGEYKTFFDPDLVEIFITATSILLSQSREHSNDGKFSFETAYTELSKNYNPHPARDYKAIMTNTLKLLKTFDHSNAVQFSRGTSTILKSDIFPYNQETVITPLPHTDRLEVIIASSWEGFAGRVIFMIKGKEVQLHPSFKRLPKEFGKISIKNKNGRVTVSFEKSKGEKEWEDPVELIQVFANKKKYIIKNLGLPWLKLTYPVVADSDAAMRAQSSVLKTADRKPATQGGIDFDRAKMQLKVHRDPSAHKDDASIFKFDPAMIERIKTEGFDGLEFHIETITPITNLPLLLGLRKEEVAGHFG